MVGGHCPGRADTEGVRARTGLSSRHWPAHLFGVGARLEVCRYGEGLCLIRPAVLVLVMDPRGVRGHFHFLPPSLPMANPSHLTTPFIYSPPSPITDPYPCYLWGAHEKIWPLCPRRYRRYGNYNSCTSYLHPLASYISHVRFSIQSVQTCKRKKNGR